MLYKNNFIGSQFLDQYSLLHFVVGIVVYFWGLPFWLWNALHILFELGENTSKGMYLIDHFAPFWPGGKNYVGSWLNIGADVLCGAVGWMLAYWLDSYGSEKGWFHRHRESQIDI